MDNFDVISEAGLRVPIFMWTRGVQVEPAARDQLVRTARMPFLFRNLVVMPDVHKGDGATVGTVMATIGAIIPAAVGRDIGCGMMANLTSLDASDLPHDLNLLLRIIERAVPHGRSDDGGANDKGAWRIDDLPPRVQAAWEGLRGKFGWIVKKHSKIGQSNHVTHLGTLGTGNHFIEVCFDEQDRVWIVVHSGSRGVGAKIGGYFTALAKQHAKTWFIDLPDPALAYLPEGTPHFADYMEAAEWAQAYALENRRIMMAHIIEALRASGLLPDFADDLMVVSCHHNYVARENHSGRDVLVTRKGAVRAREGDLGIIPGSMGARSYIVRGKGSRDSFTSCSHGAGRAMSRTEAKRRFTMAEHESAMHGVASSVNADILEETPAAYKPIDAVMAAQADLVEAVHELHQVVCVKG